MSNNKPPEHIWSNTDFPYMCLKDVKRTKTFGDVISQRVSKGDIVIDVGSGSGILSFFAAKAGAKRVYAVEIDHMLASALRRSVKENGLEDTIVVVEEDIMTADLPAANVVIAEIIDTGLMDEMQAPAMNCLWEREVIVPDTKVIPARYETYVDLVDVDNEYYGYQILAPKHEWPFYDSGEKEGWCKTRVNPVSDKAKIASYDFEKGIVPLDLDVLVDFNVGKDFRANAIRLSGVIVLGENVLLGPTNAVNGDKILAIDNIGEGAHQFRIKNKLGNGLGALEIIKLS